MEEDVKYAGFWVRFAALFLDGIVLSVTYLIISNFMLDVSILPPDFSEFLMPGKDFIGLFRHLLNMYKPLIISNLMLFLISVLYAVIMTWIFGATLGKMAVGIKVVRDDFQPITFGGAFIREVLIKQFLYGILFFISWLGYFWVSWDKRKQGWHDKIARTVVIKERGAVSAIQVAAVNTPSPAAPPESMAPPAQSRGPSAFAGRAPDKKPPAPYAAPRVKEEE